MRLIIWFFVGVVMAASVSALSISIPQERHFTFEPNINISVPFQVVNNDGREQKVTFYSTGELAEYVHFDPASKVTLEPGEKYIFWARFELPESIPPGEHVPRIGASGSPPDGQQMIGATTSVQVRVFIRGRHEGKALKPYLRLKPLGVEEPMEIQMEYRNVGTEDIDEVASRVTIYDNLGKARGLLQPDPIELPYDNVRTITKTFSTKGLPAGVYTANATIIADGKIAEVISQEFRLGERGVDVLSHTSTLHRGGVEPFEVNISSLWNQDLKEVYLTLELPREGLPPARFQSPSVTLKPFQILPIRGYLDTTNTSLGTTNVKVSVSLPDQGESKVEVLPVQIIEADATATPKIFTDRVFLVLVVLIIVLIVANISWFVYFERRGRRG